jgi:hypothetical protein
MDGETNDMSIVDEALHVMNVGGLPLLRTTAPTTKSHSPRVSSLMLSSLLPHTVLHTLESMLQIYGILLSRQNLINSISFGSN